MPQKTLNPKTAVSPKLYEATLKYVNALRAKAGVAPLAALPQALPGIEGCPIGRALQPLHKLHTPYDLPYRGCPDDGEDDNDYYEDYDGETSKAPVRVTTFSGSTRIRIRAGKEFKYIQAPKYITKFLDAFEKKASEVFK